MTDEEVHQAALDDPDAQPMTEEDFKRMAVIRPVVKDGEVQLYDIYMEGEWVGSRRTRQQCIDMIRSTRKA